MKQFINKFKVFGAALSLCALSLLSAQAAGGSFTLILPPLGVSNLVSSVGAPVIVRKVVIAAPASSNTSVLVYDAPALITTYSNVSYSTITQYATNIVTSYTNFFGAVNTYTNIGLWGVTNTVAAQTNSYTIKFTAAAAAANMATINDASFFFMNGVLVTNTSLTGQATLTIEYDGR